ncbi:hypothetical protein [Serratia marcescens]|uniref:hypothetical protein n=1 Tax=Serratia marcescens TaxID=615 RepID=UPI003204A0B7
MYFFVLIVNPVAWPPGNPARQRQRPGKSIALAVKIIINLSFSDTIFYLFALRKVLPLTYFDEGNENEKNSARGIRLYGMGAVEFRRQECERLIGRLFPADAVVWLK